jgi:hypothetical protein
MAREPHDIDPDDDLTSDDDDDDEQWAELGDERDR